jgi:hypothetical protein
LPIFRSPCFGLDADSIKIIPALKKELASQQEKLCHQLKTTWHKTIFFSTEEDAKGKKTTHSIIVRDESSSEGDKKTKETMTELLQALSHIGLLDDMLVPFVGQLKSNFLAVFWSSRRCALHITPESFSLTVSRELDTDTGLEPAAVFTHVKQLVHFLRQRLDVPLSGAEGAETFLRRLGASLDAWLCDSLIRYGDLLSSSNSRTLFLCKAVLWIRIRFITLMRIWILIFI